MEEGTFSQYKCLCVLTVLVGSGAYAESPVVERRSMSPVDMVELTRLEDPVLSPDGRYLLYLRSRVDWHANEEVDRYRLVDLSTGARWAILDSATGEESFERPAWSPDSTGFVTVLERDEDDHDQAYFFDLSEQTLARLTQHHEDVGDVVWAPDGSGFYFRTKAPLAEGEAERLEKKWVVQEYEFRQAAEVWFFDRRNRESQRVIGGDFHVRDYALSRDGSRIVYRSDRNRLLDDRLSEVHVYDIRRQRSRRLTDNRHAESEVRLSPDNRRFAFIAIVDEAGETYFEDNLFVQTVGDADATLILPEAKMEVLDFDWDRSGEGLFILGNTGVRTDLFHYGLETSTLSRLTTGEHALADWSYDAGLDVHVFLKRTQENPGEVYTLTGGGDDARRVTDEYRRFSVAFELPRQTVFEWTGRDGSALEGILVYPVGYETGKRFPLVTITHGGPRSSSQFGSWNVSRYLPVLAGQGYGVFLPNHRGGTGYGDAFMRDMVGGYFNNAHLDVLDGVDALVDAGLADPDRLVKMGWSAGGHMTNKLITFTDRFRVASSGAGAADWISMYGESDTRHNRRPWFGGSPWEEDAPLRSFVEQSMLKDAWRIRTPTLFFVGGDDERVPPTQAILMYRGAKAAGAETELYVAPDQPHGYEEPSYRLFKINKELEWFAKHLGREPFEAVLPAP